MEHFFVNQIRNHHELELPRARQSRKRRPLLIALHGYLGDRTLYGGWRGHSAHPKVD